MWKTYCKDALVLTCFTPCLKLGTKLNVCPCTVIQQNLLKQNVLGGPLTQLPVTLLVCNLPALKFAESLQGHALGSCMGHR